MILIDTNVIVGYASKSHHHKETSVSAIRKLSAQGEQLCIVPQVVYEFWSVATRPVEAKGLGLSCTEALDSVKSLTSLFRILPDRPTLYTTWESLVVQFQCHGRVSFDARLVAAMQNHGISHIITFNGSDFARFPSIQAIDPCDL